MERGQREGPTGRAERKQNGEENNAVWLGAKRNLYRCLETRVCIELGGRSGGGGCGFFALAVSIEGLKLKIRMRFSFKVL